MRTTMTAALLAASLAWPASAQDRAPAKSSKDQCMEIMGSFNNPKAPELVTRCFAAWSLQICKLRDVMQGMLDAGVQNQGQLEIVERSLARLHARMERADAEYRICVDYVERGR